MLNTFQSKGHQWHLISHQTGFLNSDHWNSFSTRRIPNLHNSLQPWKMPGSTFTTDVLRLTSLILPSLPPGKLFPCSLLEASLCKFALGRLVGCFSQQQRNFQEFYTEWEPKVNPLNGWQRKANPYHDSFRHLEQWRETQEEVNGMLLGYSKVCSSLQMCLLTNTSMSSGDKRHARTFSIVHRSNYWKAKDQEFPSAEEQLPFGRVWQQYLWQ